MLSLVLLFAGYASAQDYVISPTMQRGESIKRYIYKNTPQGKLAIYLHFPPGWSKQDKRPAIVFFFGGGWYKGSIAQFRYQAEYLASRGMVTARADYRVKSRHGTTLDKAVEDAKSAVRWLRANAARLGIDPNRIAAAGGSAGGHIAACTTLPTAPESKGEDTSISSRANLLILFNPVLDVSIPKIVKRFGSLETARSMSPNLHLGKNTPPTLLMYGTEDRLLSQGKIYLAKAKELGITAVLYTAEGVGHGFFNKPPWLNKTLYLADQFLARYGYTKGNPTIPVSKKAVMQEITLNQIRN